MVWCVGLGGGVEENVVVGCVGIGCGGKKVGYRVYGWMRQGGRCGWCRM